MAIVETDHPYNGASEALTVMAERGPSGGPNADELVQLVHGELRRLAASYLKGERPDHTLRPTEVVNEAYVRLARLDRIEWQGESHFKAIAAVAMRRVLIDHARRRAALFRPSPKDRVTFTDAVLGSEEGNVDVLDLDAALTELEARSERQARVVECRVFAGMTVPETAAALEVSERTVKNDWRFAKAWLRARLSE